MSVTALSSPVARAEVIKPQGLWLRNRTWDTIFMTMSVFLVPMPYVFYLIGMQILPSFGLTDQKQISDVSRNVVNLFVALAVGGPHMYATFLRTALDKQFVKRYPMLIRSSIIIPIVVVSLAFLNLTLLLTVFFFWASIHVLHQVVYIVELYNHRTDGKTGLAWWSRMVDYALILTCLFPIAALKISRGAFAIGENDLTSAIPEFFQQAWFFYAATGIFVVAVVAYLVKTYREWRGGYIHWPKTIFMMITVPVACFMPALDNLDTAFQGLNTWHSFQYLALTFYIIKLREQAGDLTASNQRIARLAQGKDSRKLYFFTWLMLGGSLTLGVIVFITVSLVAPHFTMNQRFDTAYYTAILCFLWIHYYHDHFLFTDFEAIQREVK